MNWYEKTSEETLSLLQSNEERGLSDENVNERILKYGINALAEKKRTSLIVRFFLQLNDFMIFILLIAAGVSVVIAYLEGSNDYADPIIILSIVTINAILGLVQESKAEKAIEALKKMSSPSTKTLRNGHIHSINTSEIVPGDIILLESGDFVPADARLIKAYNLKVEESALTGESVPVDKDSSLVLEGNIPTGDKKNMVFSGSTISYGRAKAIIVETGMNTEVGKIASLIMEEESPETPLQKKLEETGKILGIGALIICAVIFFMGVLRKVEMFEMFMTSVSLAVAAIPEGLPAIVTIMLAMGVQRMAKRNAVIRKIPAVETLGSATVICSDKTGTLTENKMEVVEISDGFNKLNKLDEDRKNILALSCMCNDSFIETDENGNINKIGDPTELAIVVASQLSGIYKEKLEEKSKRVAEIPFDSKRKLMSTIHTNQETGYIVITKGAPDVLLSKANFYYKNGEIIRLSSTERARIEATNLKMTDKALRVIAVGIKNIDLLPTKLESKFVEKDLIFVGLIGMIDPPRKEVAEAVSICKQAGIKPVMVTGDHVNTAIAIGKQIGIMDIHDKALTGAELNEISQEKLEEDIYNYSIFARVSPEHKMRIVKAFQARGEVVAMTGDGVNDAPALKYADIGCAMGITGTDVAKGAADIVLADDNFATIVEAVKEGRSIYSNVRKAVHFLLSSNIGEIITIFIAIFLGWNTPLLAIHLLWVNLVTDSLPAIALGLDPTEDDVMKRKAYNKEKSLFSEGLWQKIVLEGIMIGFLSLIAFGIGVIYFDKDNSVAIGRTMAFATLSISQLVHAFNMRSDKSLFEIKAFENIYLVGAFIVGTIMQVSVIMIKPLSTIFKVVPLEYNSWIVVIILCIMPIVIVELEKRFTKDNKEVYFNKSIKA